MHKARFIEFLTVLLSYAGSAILSLVLVIFLSNRMFQSDFGTLTLYLTFVNFIQQIAFSPIANAAGRCISSYTAKEAKCDFFNLVLRISLTSITIALIAGLISLYIVSDFTLLLLFCYATIISLVGILESSFGGARKRLHVLAFSYLNPALRITLVAVIFYLSWVSELTALVGLCIGSVIVFIIELLVLKNNLAGLELNNSTSNELRRSFWQFAKPFAIWGGFSFCQQSSDRWILFWFTNTQWVAVYSIYFQLAYSSMLLGSVCLSQFILPILYEKYESAATNTSAGIEINRKISIGLLVTTLFLSLSIMPFEQILVQTFLSEGYWFFAPCVPLLIIAGGLYAASQSWANSLFVLKQTHLLTSSKIYLSILAIFFYTIGSGLYGCAGLVIAQCAFSLLSYLWTRRVVLNKLNTLKNLKSK